MGSDSDESIEELISRFTLQKMEMTVMTFCHNYKRQARDIKGSTS